MIEVWQSNQAAQNRHQWSHKIYIYVCDKMTHVYEIIFNCYFIVNSQTFCTPSLSFVSTKSVRDSIIEIWTNRLGLCCDTSFVLFVGAVAINKFKKGINTFKSFYFLFFLNKDIISHSYSLSPIEIIDYSYVSRIILMGSVYLNTKVIQTISIESGTHLLKLTTLCPFCKILRALGSQCCCSI